MVCEPYHGELPAFVHQGRRGRHSHPQPPSRFGSKPIAYVGTPKHSAQFVPRLGVCAHSPDASEG